MTEAPERVAILGATSAITEAAARIWAARGARLALMGRNAVRVEAIAADLRGRGATQAETFVAYCAQADATSLVKRIIEILGGLDVALLAYGVLGDQAQFERDPDAMVDLLQSLHERGRLVRDRFHENSETRFGCAVNIIGRASAIARHRTDHQERAGALTFKNRSIT
jgi:NAD(P)-dependent dehydrogenase (short-subunit alcohol dehydrogenase family)